MARFFSHSRPDSVCGKACTPKGALAPVHIPLSGKNLSRHRRIRLEVCANTWIRNTKVLPAQKRLYSLPRPKGPEGSEKAFAGQRPEGTSSFGFCPQGAIRPKGLCNSKDLFSQGLIPKKLCTQEGMFMMHVCTLHEDR